MRCGAGHRVSFGWMPEFAMLTEAIALCWIHDGRHYKELTPRLAHHKEQLTTFLTKYWN
jgi:hypothetical protein